MRRKISGVITLGVLFFLVDAVALGEPQGSELSQPYLSHQELGGALDADILPRQRVHVWRVLSSIAPVSGGKQALLFADWFNEAEVFSAKEQRIGQRRVPFPGLPIGTSAAAEIRMSHYGDAPLITFVHYNVSAYRHIRQHQLYREKRLQEIGRAGENDATFPSMKTIPPFPPTAVVMMTGWWPVDAQGLTPMPVWDPDPADLKMGGNNYTSWKRVVAIGPGESIESRQSTTLVFAGRAFPVPRHVHMNDLFHIKVDRPMAMRLMADIGSRKAAVLVLGRPLEAGDLLALVGMHIFSAESSTGIWGTFWWHDRPMEGPFAKDRPDNVKGVWRNYLMDTAFDAMLPREPDGSARVCFNPWFEAKFPDGGQGNGVTSNCVNCHSRASYPTIDFLPIRRGYPEPLDDPAFAAGRVRTGQLWSVANPNLANGKKHRSRQAN